MTPKLAFQMQRSAAKQRGIGWLLSFEDWWKIWTDSGRWAQRGRRFDAYVMCRFGDVGPYEVGNVFIGRLVDNVSAARRKHALPMGVFPNGKRYITKFRRNGVRFYFGPFDTPEEASAAYRSAVA